MVYNLHRVYPLLLIAVVLLASTQCSITIDTLNSDVKPLIEYTRCKIPSNLPWYPIVVFGDNRPSNVDEIRYPDVFYNMIDEIKLINPIAVIGTGDHVGKGYESQYLELYRVFNESGLCNIWLTIGNHDVSVPEGFNNWLKYIGPEYYYIDDIPGWRIGVVNSETKLSSDWRNQLEYVYSGLKNRSLILVFHRPAHPNVNYNLNSDYINILREVMKLYGNPRIVFQGHWHGWAYQYLNDTLWVITGGAGAPLYYYRGGKLENGSVVTGKYHYVILILYPNQTYRLHPVSITDGSINIKSVNNTVLIENTKRDVYGEYVEIPVRIKLNILGETLYFVALTPANSIVNVQWIIENDGIAFNVNHTMSWYIYVERRDGKLDVYTPSIINGIYTVKIPITTFTATNASYTTETPLDESINTRILPGENTRMGYTNESLNTTSGGGHDLLQDAYIILVILIITLMIAVTTYLVLTRRSV